MSAVDHETVEIFIQRHELPANFRRTVREHYLPLAAWVSRRLSPGRCLVLGINGAQGTGKTTLAEFLRATVSASANVAVLSLDDFYLTRTERETLGKRVHPLLATRGVPGTHDIRLLKSSLARLKALRPNDNVTMPTFDKSTDDRTARGAWKTVVGPVDLVIMEGWCVGWRPSPARELAAPLNALEETHDADGRWRCFVNAQLAAGYAELFAELDALVFLQTPSFEAIHRWRLEQEQKLAGSVAHTGARLMSARQIVEFIQHYERVTRNDLAVLPAVADVVLRLAENHECVESRYRTD